MNVHPNLEPLVHPIDEFVPLEKNPNTGDVQGIASSLEAFGQLKPIVAHQNEDGSYTIVAGNHTWEAARSLGWERIAAVILTEDEEISLAYALVDNELGQRGDIDESLLFENLATIDNPDITWVLDDMGWDDFAMAAMEEAAILEEERTTERGYTPPELISQPQVDRTEYYEVEEDDEDDDERIVASDKVDPREAIVSGVPEASAPEEGRNRKPVIQYTIAFADSNQQQEWNKFLRWLRNQDRFAGETTTDKLLQFIREETTYDEDF